MTRWIAKSLVAAGLVDRILVQVGYAIGVAEPLSINVNSYNTGIVDDQKLLEIINKNFDLKPGMIIKQLDLKKPKYKVTAAYCHFGREEEGFTWEFPKKLQL